MSVFYKSVSFDLDGSNVSRARANIGNSARACLKGLLLIAIFLSVGISAQTISPQMIAAVAKYAACATRGLG